jgi:hypothetical protein
MTPETDIADPATPTRPGMELALRARINYRNRLCPDRLVRQR